MWTIDATDPHTTIQPVPGVRYVRRWITQIHMGDKINVQTLVLQQKYAGIKTYPDGKSKCFVEWRDVPTEEETA
jgi:hypothetical protein